MKTIKAIAFSCMVLFTLTAGKCHVGYDSSHDDDDEDEDREGLTIVVTNVEAANSEIVQTLNQTLAVAEIASRSAQYVNDVYIAGQTSYSCDNTTGVVLLTLNDLDQSNNVSIGDDLLLSYIDCELDNALANGELVISVLGTKGSDIGHCDSSTSWLFALNANANSLQVKTGSNLFIVNGEIKIVLQLNATTATLEANVTSESFTLDDGLQTLLSNIDISQFINLAVMPSNYLLKINSMSISNSALNGTFNATTISNPLSGMELLNLDECFVDLQLPDNGLISITGKNSYADVSIVPDELVSIELDTNGDSISDAVISSTWSEIQ